MIAGETSRHYDKMRVKSVIYALKLARLATAASRLDITGTEAFAQPWRTNGRPP